MEFSSPKEQNIIFLKMLIFPLCLLLSIRKAESAECLLKYGFGLNKYVTSILVETQPSGTFDLNGCKTSCDKEVYKK